MWWSCFIAVYHVQFYCILTWTVLKCRWNIKWIRIKLNLFCTFSFSFLSFWIFFFYKFVVFACIFYALQRNSSPTILFKSEVMFLFWKSEIKSTKATCPFRLNNQAIVWLLDRQSAENRARFQQSPPELNHLFWTLLLWTFMKQWNLHSCFLGICDEAVQPPWWIPGTTTSFGLVATSLSVHSRA